MLLDVFLPVVACRNRIRKFDDTQNGLGPFNFRMWVNPQSLEDMQHVHEQLVKLQQFPEANSLTVEMIRAASQGNMRGRFSHTGSSVDCKRRS